MHVLHELGCYSLVRKAGIRGIKRKRRTCLTHDEYYVDVEIEGEEQAVLESGQGQQVREKEQIEAWPSETNHLNATKFSQVGQYMVRSCSSCSTIGRSVGNIRGRSPQSFFASPKLILPFVTRSFPHRNSTKHVHSHSLLRCPYQSFPRANHQVLVADDNTHLAALRDLTPSDAQRRTIYALSTPPGKGGVAIIRVSGPDACKVRKAVTRPVHVSTIDKAPIPRLAELRRVVDPLTGEKLDDGLVLFFKGEFSGSKF